jgi:DNA-binding MarR family transcriptional regulator
MWTDDSEVLLKFSRICCKLNLITRRNFNLTAGELQCLISLNYDKPCCIRKLCEITGTRGTTTSKLLNSLEKKSLIKRELDTKDKRIEKVFLTSAGKEFTLKLASFYKNKFISISGFSNDDQYRSFIDFLNQLSLEAERSPELHGDLFLT